MPFITTVTPTSRPTRLLKDHGLITSLAFILMKEADRYRHGDVSKESRRADWLPVERQARRRR
jgi:hypothetical protein